MNGRDSHRGVEGLVLEREALRGGSHARRRACGALRTHDRRRFHCGDVTAGGATGVELAGELAEMLPEVASRHGLAPDRPAVLLIEAGPTLLAGSSPQLIPAWAA